MAQLLAQKPHRGSRSCSCSCSCSRRSKQQHNRRHFLAVRLGLGGRGPAVTFTHATSTLLPLAACQQDVRLTAQWQPVRICSCASSTQPRVAARSSVPAFPCNSARRSSCASAA